MNIDRHGFDGWEWPSPRKDRYYLATERRTLVKIMPTRITKLQAIMINVPTTTKGRIARSTKAKTTYLQKILKSTRRRTDAIDVENKGTVIVTVPRRLKELHKQRIFYPHKMMMCQALFNFVILGEE